MFKWEFHNPSAVTLWGYLGFRREIAGTFQDARSITIGQFAFWNEATSDHLNRIGAEALAKDIHHHFGMLLESAYEDDAMTYANAIKTLMAVLGDERRTLEDLGRAVDDLFHVPGEAPEEPPE